jgi:hypothetical protein
MASAARSWLVKRAAKSTRPLTKPNLQNNILNICDYTLGLLEKRANSTLAAERPSRQVEFLSPTSQRL